MSVTIGDITFDRVSYDAGGDVLYLHRADPQSAVDFDESPEGHHLRYDHDGRLIGLTIVRARRLLESEGASRSRSPSRSGSAPMPSAKR